MKIKTSKLTDAALDWAVMIALGHKVFPSGDLNVGKFGPLFGKTEYGAALGVQRVRPSTDWSQGGPIIAREGISTVQEGDAADWVASVYDHKADDWHLHTLGETPLIAAMRCYVASNLGEEVEIPNELIGE